jgi:FkbM family methyltransferase
VGKDFKGTNNEYAAPGSSKWTIRVQLFNLSVKLRSYGFFITMSRILAVRRRVSPYQEIMNAADYWRVKRYPSFKHGIGKIYGQPIQFSDKVGFLYSVNEIYLQEVYKFCTDKIDPLIIDAGANIGLSLIYFKRLYPQARIIAYEPDNSIFKLLESNVANLALSNVELHNSAAWVENTNVAFFSEGSLAGSTEVDFLGIGKESNVRAERLKDVLYNQRVASLKLDIDGGANKVLFDIVDCLENVDHLFFEYHSQPNTEQKLGTMLDLVKSAGFRYVINGTHAPNHPFVDRVTRGFDLQLNVSCFRL